MITEKRRKLCYTYSQRQEQKLHIFPYPFYYIEYALSQICAFQYYGRMKEDRPAAWADYLRLCRAGGTKGYFELLETGNLENPFRDGTGRDPSAT